MTTAAWHWISAHSLHLLVVIYACTLACTILLAMVVLANSRRIGKLARESKKQGALLNALAGRVESQAEQPAAPLPPPPVVAAGAEIDSDRLTSMRQEIIRLQAELESGVFEVREDANTADPDTGAPCATDTQNQ